MSTQTDIVRRILMKNRNRWVPMPKLAKRMGGFAVHSRIADLRAEGMTIINKQTKRDGVRKSFYRFLPKDSGDVSRN